MCPLCVRVYHLVYHSRIVCVVVTILTLSLSLSVCVIGMFGVSFFSAVINPPQACILAVGSGVSRVVPPSDAKDANPRVINTVQVQLSADRRVVDEATAAQFLQVLQKYLADTNALVM